MKKVLFAVSILLVLSMLAWGCAGPAPTPTPTPAKPTPTPAKPTPTPAPAPAEPEVLKWRIQSAAPATDVMCDTLSVLADTVKEKSEGRIEITVFPSGELVPVTEMGDACKEGMLEMANWVGAYFAGTVTEGEIEFQLPLACRDAMETCAMFDSGMRDFLREGYAPHGLYYLKEVPVVSWLLMGNEPIRKMEDFKGVKIRASGSQQMFLNALGASTVFITGAEVYPALQLGTVDAAGWSSQAWEALNYKEVCKYYLKPALGFPTCNLLVNMEAWNALPIDLKNALELAAERYTRACMTEALAMERRQEVLMREGAMIVLPDDEVAKMREVAIGVWDEIGAKSPRNAEAVKIVKDYLRAHAVIE